MGRGAALGGVMAAQALSCGYYGVFVILMVGYGVIVMGMTRKLWANTRFWVALGAAALVSMALVLPAFLPYLELQRGGGFRRALEEANRYSANWSAYLASPAYAHSWMLQFLPPWREAVFPGFVATILGAAGAWVARGRHRETLWLYGGLAVLACWTSFGPAGLLYSALYWALPMFAWLRAPARFGVMVCFALSVLAGVGVSILLRDLSERAAAFKGPPYAKGVAAVLARRAGYVTLALAILAAAEHVVPLNLPEVPPVETAYRMLALSPPGPVIEMPFYYPAVGLFQHSKYMLASTAHWKPLVNGYSDYIPPDFIDHVMTLAPFPSRDAFKLLEPNRVRYAMFHMYGYNTENRNDVLTRLKQFESYLRPLYVDENTRLYEIVGFPP
jgi:hypothetical protein